MHIANRKAEERQREGKRPICYSNGGPAPLGMVGKSSSRTCSQRRSPSSPDRSFLITEPRVLDRGPFCMFSRTSLYAGLPWTWQEVCFPQNSPTSCQMDPLIIVPARYRFRCLHVPPEWATVPLAENQGGSTILFCRWWKNSREKSLRWSYSPLSSELHLQVGLVGSAPWAYTVHGSF